MDPRFSPPLRHGGAASAFRPCAPPTPCAREGVDALPRSPTDVGVRAPPHHSPTAVCAVDAPPVPDIVLARRRAAGGVAGFSKHPRWRLAPRPGHGRAVPRRPAPRRPAPCRPAAPVAAAGESSSSDDDSSKSAASDVACAGPEAAIFRPAAKRRRAAASSRRRLRRASHDRGPCEIPGLCRANPIDSEDEAREPSPSARPDDGERAESTTLLFASAAAQPSPFAGLFDAPLPHADGGRRREAARPSLDSLESRPCRQLFPGERDGSSSDEALAAPAAVDGRLRVNAPNENCQREEAPLAMRAPEPFRPPFPNLAAWPQILEATTHVVQAERLIED